MIRELLERLGLVDGGVLVVARNGDMVHLLRGRVQGKELRAVDSRGNGYTWVIEDMKPYIGRVRNRMVPVFFVDMNSQIVYRFGEPDKGARNDKARRSRLNPVMLNPEILYSYISGKTVEKLLGKLQVTKIELLLYMSTGMLLTFIIEFMILPLLGHTVTIR